MKNSILLLAIATAGLPSLAWGQSTAPFTLEGDPATQPATAPAMDDSPAPIAEEDRWNYTLSIPIWLVGVQGDLTVDGRELSGDQDTADDVDELFDSNLNGAMALHFEAQKSRFGLLLDAMYLDRSIEGTTGATDAEASLMGFVGEVGAIYTILPPEPDKQGWGMVRVDALGGLRTSALELGLETATFDDEASRTFYDPFVGARVEVGLTRWLSFRLRGDIGGFGIDAWNTTDFSYNIDTGLEFHLTRCFDLGLGYRWLNYDLDLGSNSSVDATLSGPVVELKFSF